MVERMSTSTTPSVGEADRPSQPQAVRRLRPRLAAFSVAALACLLPGATASGAGRRGRPGSVGFLGGASGPRWGPTGPWVGTGYGRALKPQGVSYTGTPSKIVPFNHTGRPVESLGLGVLQVGLTPESQRSPQRFRLLTPRPSPTALNPKIECSTGRGVASAAVAGCPGSCAESPACEPSTPHRRGPDAVEGRRTGPATGKGAADHPSSEARSNVKYSGC
jgi:hypothetical protein